MYMGFVTCIVKKTKIKREIKMLSMLAGHPHIIELLDAVVDNSTRTPTLVKLYIFPSGTIINICLSN